MMNDFGFNNFSARRRISSLYAMLESALEMPFYVEVLMISRNAAFVELSLWANLELIICFHANE
jgi:hypothetical protein